MAVPKRKMGRARTHARRSTNDKIAAPSRSVCPQNRSTLRGFDAPDLALARFLFAYRSMLPRRGRRCAASALAQYQVPQSLSLTDTRE